MNVVKSIYTSKDAQTVLIQMYYKIDLKGILEIFFFKLTTCDIERALKINISPNS